VSLTKLLLYLKSKYFCIDIDFHQAKKLIFKGQFRNASTKDHYILCGTLEFYNNSALQKKLKLLSQLYGKNIVKLRDPK
jgi:hypothetical protein